MADSSSNRRTGFVSAEEIDWVEATGPRRVFAECLHDVEPAMQVGPAEGLDVIVDFTGKFGQEIYLMEADSLTPLLKFRVSQQAADNTFIPATLRSLPDIGAPTVTRSFTFNSTSSHWTINGQLYEPGRIDAQPVLGTTERWLFANPTTSYPDLGHFARS